MHQSVSNILKWKPLKNSSLINYSLPTEVIYIKEVLNKATYIDRGPIFKIKATISFFITHREIIILATLKNITKQRLSLITIGITVFVATKTLRNLIAIFMFSVRIEDASTEAYVNIFGKACETLLRNTTNNFFVT